NSINYTVYDALNMPVATKSENTIVTLMGASPFTLVVDPYKLPNSVTVRLVGFDNSMDNNPDNCPVAFKTAKSDKFDGFTLQVNSPLVSLAFTDPITVTADTTFTESQDLSQPGIISSPGYNGCKKQKKGGIQNFRSLWYDYPEYRAYKLSSIKEYKVSMVIDCAVDKDHALTISDVTANMDQILSGTFPYNSTFPDTKELIVTFGEMPGDQGFVLSYSAIEITKTTNKVTSVATSPTTSTSTITPTTSSSWASNGLIISLFAVALSIAR
ncbi:hypothetical protein PFISCL1PPCAC_19097, partial [Pristionchus fissidentatus]